MRTSLLLAPLTICCCFAIACPMPEVDLAGKACDSDHPCEEGFECNGGVCQTPGTAEPDAGLVPDAGLGESCSGSHLRCIDGALQACHQGSLVLLDDCSRLGLGCDPVRGCLTRCSSEQPCAPGESCDEASGLCVKQPACATTADCSGEERSCVHGACLSAPPGGTVIESGTEVAADLSCYLEPSATTPGPTVRLKGYLASPAGTPTERTVGYTLKVFLADDLHRDPSEAQPLAETVISLAMIGDSEAGAFDLETIPTGVELVAFSEGDEGLPTWHYFDVQAALAQDGVVEPFVLFSYDQRLWGTLTEGAGQTPLAGRAGVDGQAYDCHTPSLRIQGATAALSTLTPAFYSHPGLVGVDAEASATTDTGRFFFFDVPATTLTAVVGSGDPLAAATKQIRTFPNSITVFAIQPVR